MSRGSSLVLCHACLAWVDTKDDRCPLCQDWIDLDKPDPAPEQLQRLIGELQFELGEVAVRRRLLPELGTLFVTEGGLLFVPHEISGIASSEDGEAGTSMWWVVLGFLWTPFMFLAPLLRSANNEAQSQERLEPIRVPREIPEHLPDLLMKSPGTFFVQRRGIRRFRRRGARFQIECFSGAKWKLYPNGDVVRFRDRVRNLGERHEWQGLIHS